MPRKKNTQPVTLTGLTREMLSSLMPEEDNASDALTQMGIKRTGAALVVFGLIQKAAKGDPSAAKFLKELNGEEDKPELTDSIGLETLSDELLLQIAGIHDLRVQAFPARGEGVERSETDEVASRPQAKLTKSTSSTASGPPSPRAGKANNGGSNE